MAKDGEIIYELRGDDSHLDADLNQAEKRQSNPQKRPVKKRNRLSVKLGRRRKKSRKM